MEALGQPSAKVSTSFSRVWIPLVVLPTLPLLGPCLTRAAVAWTDLPGAFLVILHVLGCELPRRSCPHVLLPCISSPLHFLLLLILFSFLHAWHEHRTRPALL
jgi:hypothetical protein